MRGQKNNLRNCSATYRIRRAFSLDGFNLHHKTCRFITHFNFLFIEVGEGCHILILNFLLRVLTFVPYSIVQLFMRKL